MTKRHLFCSAILCAAILPGTAMFGQGPVQNVNSQKHFHLASAQSSISQAYQQVGQAQGSNHHSLGGHAEKAKALLSQAAQELSLAAQYADQHAGGHR